MLLLCLIMLDLKNILIYFKKCIVIRKFKKLVLEIKWLYGIESINCVILYVELVDDFIGIEVFIFQMRILKRYIEKDDGSVFYVVLVVNVNNFIRFLEE